MYTADDYYEGWCSPCHEAMQSDIDWLCDEFDKLLESLRLVQTPRSEWYYSQQHEGIHAKTTTSFDAYGPCETDRKYPENIVGYYNKRYSRMRALYEYIDDLEAHLNDCGVYINGWGCWKYVHKRDEKYDRWLDAAKREYEGYVEETLEEMCSLFERNLQDACDEACSTEAAERWAERENELEEDCLRAERIRRTESMVGQTAQYDNYEA